VSAGEAPEAGRQAPPRAHRLLPGAAARAGGQLPQVPLPVGAGSARRGRGPAALRDPGQDLVPEPAHQVEEGAAAGEGGGGGGGRAQLHLLLLLLLLLPSSDLQSALLPPAVCAARAFPSLLRTMK